ncbi:MAG: HPP family protein [Gemmatimonadales bacterium]
MKVRDIMQTKLQAVSPDVPVLEAVTTMSEQHLSALPVLDLHGAIMGVISTTDVLQAEAEADDTEARAALFESSNVSDLMTARVRTIEASAEIADAAQQMLYLDVHRLFVVEDDKLVGVVSQTDIVRAVAEQLRLAEVQPSGARAHHAGRRHRGPGKTPLV